MIRYKVAITINVLSAVLVAISIYLFLDPESYSTSEHIVFATVQTDVIESSFSLSNLIKQGSPYLGDASAPITIVDFSDFQCKLCERHVKNTEPLINETYIQTGKTALVFKHLPNRGFDSMDAHLAGQCTNDQGKFWQFHNILYKNQQPIDSGWVNEDNLRRFASEISGLNMEEFNSCFDSQKHKSLVEADLELAISLQFLDTPAFLIVNSIDGSNPVKIIGPQPFPSFKSVIDKKLAELGK